MSSTPGFLSCLWITRPGCVSPATRSRQGPVTGESTAQGRGCPAHGRRVSRPRRRGAGTPCLPLTRERAVPGFLQNLPWGRTCTPRLPPVLRGAAPPPAPESPSDWSFQKGSSSCLHSTEEGTGSVAWGGPREACFLDVDGESWYKLETPCPPVGVILTQQTLHQRAHATPALRPHQPRMLNESAGGRQARSPPLLPPTPSRGRED